MVVSISTVLPGSTSDWIADATRIVSSVITGAAGGNYVLEGVGG